MALNVGVPDPHISQRCTIISTDLIIENIRKRYWYAVPSPSLSLRYYVLDEQLIQLMGAILSNISVPCFVKVYIVLLDSGWSPVHRALLAHVKSS